jgi:hypothetical protein
MQITQRTFPIHLRTRWQDFSPALHWHTSQTVTAHLAPFGLRIRSVKVRITDADFQDLSRRTCAIEVALKPFGVASATATGADVREIVSRAAERVRENLQHEERIEIA